MDAAKLGFARDLARERGLSKTSFHQLDIAGWDEAECYDLIYCRFLLTHLRDPALVLRRMWCALRPGGRA